MKNKNTKRALLTSVLSMLLCVAMLVGSTFAWFTDSVTSGKNKIVAGNLDVELYHTNGAASEEKVEADTKLFVNSDGSDILWEPGVMVYENFTVKNVGSLALKYQLTVNADKFNTVAGTEKSLKDVLKVAILDEAFSGDRAAAQALTFDKTIADFAKEGNIEAQAADDTYAIVVYWEPSDIDNDYNLNNGKTSSDGEPLFIDLGVNLVATQDTVENDSFDNQYDAGATFPVASEEEMDEVLAEIKPGDTIKMSAMTYTKPLTLATENVTISGTDGTVFTDKVKVSAEGVTFDNITFEVPMTTAEQPAPITTENQDLTLTDCEVIRSTQAAQPYAWLVDVGSGVLTAKNTVFTAPVDPATAQAVSPSTIRAQGGVDLDGCTIATSGYGFFDSWVTKGSIKNTTFKGVDGNPILGVFNSTRLDGLVMDGCTFIMGENSTVAAGNFTVKNSTFDLTQVPENGAGNGLSIYNANGLIALENNTFKFGSNTQRGINLTWADWAQGDHDAANVKITGNKFEGTGSCAIRVTNVWTNVPADNYAGNTFNGNTVIVEPANP